MTLYEAFSLVISMLAVVVSAVSLFRNKQNERAIADLKVFITNNYYFEPSKIDERGDNTMSEGKRDTYNVTSHGQQGGITAGQVHIQPGWRDLSRNSSDIANINQIIAMHSGKPIKFIVPMGDAEAMNYAIQIRDALKRQTALEVQDFIHEGTGWQQPLPPLSYSLEDSEGREWVKVQIGNRDSQSRPTGR